MAETMDLVVLGYLITRCVLPLHNRAGSLPLPRVREVGTTGPVNLPLFQVGQWKSFLSMAVNYLKGCYANTLCRHGGAVYCCNSLLSDRAFTGIRSV